jgi:dTDP-4-dehydrorhamnose 3,5-epimerase
VTPRIVERGPGGILVIERDLFRDERGLLSELWRAEWGAALGLPELVQHNLLRCEPGALRGLHFQSPRSQAKLISVIEGTVFDVGVDVRRGSATFGRAFTVELSAQQARSLYLPAGFAHGLVAPRGPALVVYHASEYHDPGSDLALRWDDPALGIAWPIREPILSARDRAAPLLAELPADRLPAL